MKKFSVKKVSKAFSGIRSMGLFAPLSYWRSRDDWGIGDLDVLLKVTEFAKKVRISILSMLPLNFPLHDNCPYANASAYIFDPVYIGLNLLSDVPGIGKEYPETAELISSMGEKIADFRRGETSANREIRECKYKVLRAIFRRFEADELKDESSEIIGLLTGSVQDPDLTRGSAGARRFKAYCLSNQWLGDHLLFFILAREFEAEDFRSWPREIALRYPQVIFDLKRKHGKEIMFEAFLQWILTEQLNFVRMKADEGEFRADLMLDQPFAFGNADVWCNLDAFVIDPETLRREYTQGAPPHRLDIPQHWQFYLMNMRNPASKRLLTDRLSFFLQFSDLLRIDHLLGYYRLYYITEDTGWEMTLEKMGIWHDINDVFKGDRPLEEKREKIFASVTQGIKDRFPQDVVSRLFDESGDLRHAHVILAARRSPDQGEYEQSQCGWYRQSSAEHGGDLLYTLLSPNPLTNIDYLEKIIKEKEMFLGPSDSIRVGFFNTGPGEEIISLFMQIAQEQGKMLVFESLGVVPKRITRSLCELGAAEFKPLFFGYQYFIGDPNEFWLDRITENSLICFSTHDTITIRGWWEGKEKWAKKKYYFKNDKQKHAVTDWLVGQGYLSEDAETEPDTLNSDLLGAVLHSAADSQARDAVIMMSNLFGSGDEGIINMPGHSGFWTARSPVTIEELLCEAEGHPSEKRNDRVSRAVSLIKFLVQKRERDSFQKQFRNPAEPRIMATHPLMGEGSKQLRFQGEDFLIDAVVYGECRQASVVLENGREEMMRELDVKNGLFPGVKIFRAYIPVDDGMIRVSPFQIALDGDLHHPKGYLIGCPRGTDMNPLSEQYGKMGR
ncbi:4-alpha-glucanotransferase [Desulfobacterales bacterium HSG2]|nr:4-alpha-glucanotransferase [Desulfobacterales bacterium HSG2]